MSFKVIQCHNIIYTEKTIGYEMYQTMQHMADEHTLRLQFINTL